jgi:hypothetical protein
MAGILDKKTRFVDLVVTQEGKRQIASGQLRAEYASFTDMHAFYTSSGSYSEICNRIYFQVMGRPENSLVIEKDDSGKLLTFDHTPTGSIVGNAIFEKENVVTEDLHKLKIATGSQFASLSTAIEKSFIRHFDQNYFLSSVDLVGDEEFEISNNNLRYEITPVFPFSSGAKKEIINVNQAEPFLLDSKITHLDNFDFLPPINEDGSAYGNYTDIRNTSKNTWEDIINELGYDAFADTFINKGNDVDVQKNTIGDYQPSKIRRNRNTMSKKEFKTITFDKTSKDNNLLIQMFEKNKNLFKKLDIVSAGVFIDNNDLNKRFEKQVYYIGKVFLDDFNTPTFINLFTLIFD